MNAITNIATSLETFFAEQDAQIAESDVQWARNIKEELNKFITEFTALPFEEKKSVSYSERLRIICGGKTWANVFYGNNFKMIEEFMRKNAKSVAKARNDKIAKKLANLDVTEVSSAQIGYCTDGFNGLFTINNNRTVCIQSIVAGGHSIQRLHQRVLVKVK
jgi:hypothetical protein